MRLPEGNRFRRRRLSKRKRRPVAMSARDDAETLHGASAANAMGKARRERRGNRASQRQSGFGRGYPASNP